MGIKVRILRHLLVFIPRINLLQASGFQSVCFNSECFQETKFSVEFWHWKRKIRQRHWSSGRGRALRDFSSAPPATPQGPVPEAPLQPPLGQALRPVASAGVCVGVGPSFASLTDSSEWSTPGDVCFPITDPGWLFLVKQQLVTNLKANHLNQTSDFFFFSFLKSDLSTWLIFWVWLQYHICHSFLVRSRKFFSWWIYVQICNNGAYGTLDIHVPHPGRNELFPCMRHSE